MKQFIFRSIIFISAFGLCRMNPVNAQCCAGGSGSCIAGGASQGVLQHGQWELNTNFQFISSDNFYKNDSPVDNGSYDSYSSQYEYFRMAYGASDKFTISLESGYYLGKKEVGLNENPATTYTSKGFGDLIIFPRYDVLNKKLKNGSFDITVGLGYKIPLGSYNDSVGNVEPFSGDTYYVIKPQSVQLSSGAQDIIFFTFLSRDFKEPAFRIFANAMYIKKGWNPNAEKLGDFFSVGLFGGKTFFEKLGLTLQLRYEEVDRMQINDAVLMFGHPSTFFPEATGYKKVFLTPQVSYTMRNFTVYANIDLPLYQYVYTSQYYTQVGSELTTTIGLSYRFFTKHVSKELKASGKYYCPMHPDVVSDTPGSCPKCGMDLKKGK
jgi:hypothetical protein